MKTFYKAKFPHIHPIGSTFFITFRLEGSIPRTELKTMKTTYLHKLDNLIKITDTKSRNQKIFDLRKRYLSKYDELMHNIDTGPTYMKSTKIMDIIKGQLHRFDGQLYDLICYSIMSNHVHMLIDTKIQLEDIPLEYKLYDNNTQVSDIMKRIKGASARYSNKELGKTGSFWCKESYDMFIRNEIMLKKVIGYILENPVKAGIVVKWEDYDGNFLMS